MNKIVLKSLLLIVAFTFIVSCKKDNKPDTPVTPEDSTVAFKLEIDKIGEITKDTAFTVRDYVSDTIDSANVVNISRISGKITYNGTFYVTINRRDSLKEAKDSLFCGGSAFGTDYNVTQELKLNLAGKPMEWFTKVIPDGDGDVLYPIEYVFNSKSESPVKVTVTYDFTPRNESK